jgi:exodeoxyribonuclease VII small subunit
MPSNAEPSESPQPASFETALADLAELVSRLESGSLGLTESIAAYERGVGLLRRLHEELAVAEEKVHWPVSEAVSSAHAQGGDMQEQKPLLVTYSPSTRDAVWAMVDGMGNAACVGWTRDPYSTLVRRGSGTDGRKAGSSPM